MHSVIVLMFLLLYHQQQKKEEIESEKLLPAKLEEESNPALPLGATTGTFLHRVLEQLEYSSVLAFSSAQEWLASKKVSATFTQILQRVLTYHQRFSSQVLH